MPLSPICPREDWRSLSSAHAWCLCHTMGTNQINQQQRCTERNVTLYGPRFGAMRVGRGPSAGPSCRGRPLFPRKAGRASFLAISGHKPVGTRQTSDQPDRTNTDRGADRSFPGRWAERAFSQSLGHKPMGTRQTRTSQTRTSSDQVAEPACCLLATLHHTNQTALGGSTI